ncbi:hypothetical protein [uncultured Treponema sp.]|uniref:hypothetical protein n=1 Tax=uncultured Treponema sp. TaxID=162155 RepID=UPI0015BC1676|nr:hypothetical protein [uncultured Treponema sp.]
MAFKENFQKYLEKGVQVSKKAWTKAESAVTKFGDESVLKIEKTQLQSKLKKEITALGQEVLDAFSEKNTISSEEEPFAARLTEIKRLKSEIQHRDELLNAAKTKEPEPETEKQPEE